MRIVKAEKVKERLDHIVTRIDQFGGPLAVELLLQEIARTFVGHDKDFIPMYAQWLMIWTRQHQKALGHCDLPFQTIQEALIDFKTCLCDWIDTFVAPVVLLKEEETVYPLSLTLREKVWMQENLSIQTEELQREYEDLGGDVGLPLMASLQLGNAVCQKVEKL